MKTSKLISLSILIVLTASVVSCRPAKCSTLDAGDVKITKHKKASMSLFSKKEKRRKRW